MENSKRKVASFVGILPGPKNGMTLSNQNVVDQLRKQCDLRIFDIGATFKSMGWSWRIRKLIQNIRSGFSIWPTINSMVKLNPPKLSNPPKRMDGCWVHFQKGGYFNQ